MTDFKIEGLRRLWRRIRCRIGRHGFPGIDLDHIPVPQYYIASEGWRCKHCSKEWFL